MGRDTPHAGSTCATMDENGPPIDIKGFLGALANRTLARPIVGHRHRDGDRRHRAGRQGRGVAACRLRPKLARLGLVPIGSHKRRGPLSPLGEGFRP